MKKSYVGCLLCVLLFFAFSNAFGAVTVVPDTVTISVDDSKDSTTTVMRGPILKEGSAGEFGAYGNTIVIAAPDGFRFVADTVKVTLSGGDLELVDSLAYVDPSDPTAIWVAIATSSTIADTITFPDLKIYPIDSNEGTYDRSSVSNDGTTTFDFIPGVWDGTTFTPYISQIAGHVILLPGATASLAWTAQPTTPVDAGNNIAATLELYDQFGNVNCDKEPVSLSAVLDGTTVPGNGVLNAGTPTVGLGVRNYGNITYTRKENIQIVAKKGTAKATSATVVVNANVPANITANYTKTTLTVDQTTEITVTVTDAYYNAVDNTEQMKIEEVQGGGGTFSPLSLFALDANGTKKVTYTPSKFYTGTVKIKVSSVDVPSVVHNKSITVNPGALGNVAITPPTVSDTVGTHTAFVIELLDTYGNHIDATSTDQVTITQGSKDQGEWTASLNATTKKIDVNYIAGKKANETDTLFVETVVGNFTDFSVITKVSGPPATMKFLSLGDSVFVAGNLATETLSDTVWDAYGNKSNGYKIVFATSGDGVFPNGLSKDTITTVNGLAQVAFRADSIAGKQTLTASYGSVSASFDVKVWPNVIAKVDLSAENPHLVAGQTTNLTLKAYDAYGVGGAGNHTIATDPNFVNVPDIQKIFAFQDTSGKHVGRGKLGTVDTSDVGDFYVPFTAWDGGSDRAVVIGTLNAVRDTLILVSNPNADLASIKFSALAKKSLATEDSLKFTITFYDTNEVVKHNYDGDVEVVLNGTDASDSQLLWSFKTAKQTVKNSTLGSTFVCDSVVGGTFDIQLKDRLAESGLTLTVKDVATGITATSDTFKFVPSNVAKLKIDIDEDIVYANVPFHFTVTPQDRFDNVNTTELVKFYMTAKYPDDLNLSSALRYITGPKTYEVISSIPREGQQLIAYYTGLPDALSPEFDVYLSTIPEGNLTLNPEFDDGLNNWTGYVSQPAAASITLDDTEKLSGKYSMRVNVTAEGSNIWDIQRYNPLPIESGYTYNISYLAVADKDSSKIRFVLEMAGSPYTAYLDTTIYIMTEPKLFEFVLEKNTVDEPTTMLKWQFGQPGKVPVNIWLDRVYATREEVELAVGKEGPAIPNEYVLDQNYPNPFNPTTNITYGLPKDANVVIDVYNLMGQKVVTLVSERQKAGYYTVNWNGRDASGNLVTSGVYIYKITTGDYAKSKKMLLVK